MKKIFDLIYVFALLGLQMIGNISSMLPILKKELIEKRSWINEEDMLDSISLGRCGPGAAVINTVIFLGNRIAGTLGGIVAPVAFCIFPCIIIILIAFTIENIIGNAIVISIFNALLVTICITLSKTIIELFKKAIVDKITFSIFVITLLFNGVFDISSVLCIVISIIISVYCMLR